MSIRTRTLRSGRRRPGLARPVGQHLAEGDPFRELEAVREDARVEVLGGLRLVPSDAEGEAKVAEWLSKSANEVHQGPWMKRAKIRRPDAIKLSDAEIDARCDHILRIMDAHLAKRDWLALDRPTIADVSCFGPISMLKVSGYETDKWPSVTRWLGAVRALPRAHDIDGKPFR